MKILQAVQCLLSFSLVYASANNDKDKRLLFGKLSAKDMGSLHNEIVMQVHDRILESMPLDHDEYSQIVYEEVITTCSEVDDSCRERVRQNIERGKVEVKEFMEAGKTFDIHSVVDEDLDSELKESLHEILEAVNLLHDQPLDNVLEVLENISNRVENSDVKDHNKVMIQMVSSVAAGSASLWSEIQQDSENAFHRLYAGGIGRKLQTVSSTVVSNALGTSTITNTVAFALSDTVGAVKGIAVPLLFFFTGLGEPTLAVESAVQQSISDSLLAIGIKTPTPMDVILCILDLSLTNCDFYSFGD